jgi:carboxylesterase
MGIGRLTRLPALTGPLDGSDLLGPLAKLRYALAGARFGDEMSGLSGLARPEPIRRPGRRPMVLALHGYCASPQEVQLVSDVATELGLETWAPWLPGHGTTPQDLATLTFEDILVRTRPIFEEATRGGPVVLAGMSMGAVLAAALALEAPERVAGLVLLASAFWLTEPTSSALKLLGRLGVVEFGIPKFSTDIADGHAAATQVSYRVQPLRPIQTLRDAGERIAARLGELTMPALIIHGAHDRACPVSNAWRLAEALGTPKPRMVVLPRSHHIVCRDLDRGIVRGELRGFFSELADNLKTNA